MKVPPHAQGASPGRNDPCPCGSGRKYKHCCESIERAAFFQAPATPRRQLKGPSEQDLLQTAERLTRAGRPLEAIAALEKMVQLSPDHPYSHFNLVLASLNVGQSERAAAGFRRAIALKPDFARAYCSLGTALEQLGQDAAAIDAFLKATQMAPKMAEAHARLGGLLRARGELAEAIHAYKEGAAAEPNTTQGRLSKAHALKWEGRNAEAETCLRSAIALDPNSSALHWLLATVLGEAGQFEEASSLFRQAIALNPAKVAIYYDFILLFKLTEADRPLVARMSDLIATAGAVGEQRAALLFALAKAHDDLGDYGEAIRRVDEANRISRRSLAFDRKAHADRTNAIIETFTATFLAENISLGVNDPAPRHDPRHAEIRHHSHRADHFQPSSGSGRG